MSRSRWGWRALGVAAIAALFAWSQRPPAPAGPPIEWRFDLETALSAAHDRGRPALLSFAADWCTNCRRLELRTLRHPEVAAELRRFERVRVDVTAWDPAALAVMDRFGVVAVPTLVVVDPEGRVDTTASRSGYLTRDELLPALRSVDTRATAPAS